MRTLRLDLSYDGTDFVGWQIQPNGPSVQQELTNAFARVTGAATIPVASGRTDSGVHALGQVAHVRTESRLSTDKLLRALNAHLPDSIVVLAVSEAPDDFDATRHAKRKLYRFVYHDGRNAEVFLRRYCWHVHEPLNVEWMRQAASLLVGIHDFRCFESNWPNRVSSVRHVMRCEPTRFGDFIHLDVQANGFLYNMVRAIAGTLYEVGRGRWPIERVARLLQEGDRSLAGPTAPAHALFLVQVDYDTDAAGTEVEPSPDIADS